MRLRVGAVCGALLIAGGAAGAETSVEIRGARFERDVTAGDQRLVLQGAGVLHYKWVVPVYAAALYVDPEASGQDVLDNVAKRIEVEYLVKAEASDFNAAGDRVLRAALTPGAYAAIEARLGQICALYPDPKPRDRCALTYRPGVGTELVFNGKVLGVIEGEDFQRAYFGVWLGKEPASQSLRKALLGAKRE